MAELNFACRTVTIEQLLKCSLSLSSTEMRLLRFLASSEGNEYEISELLEVAEKSRTTVQRALNRLEKKGLVRKRQINLDKGGYYYVYSSLSKSRIKDKISKSFEGFISAVRTAIERW